MNLNEMSENEKVYANNLILMKESDCLKADLVGEEFEVLGDRMIFIGLKNNRKNAKAVVKNMNEGGKLVTMMQRAVAFQIKRKNGAYKK